MTAYLDISVEYKFSSGEFATLYSFANERSSHRF